VCNVMDTKRTSDIIAKLFDPIESLSFGDLKSSTKPLTFETLVNMCEEALDAKLEGDYSTL
jgi:hypothetical protein